MQNEKRNEGEKLGDELCAIGLMTITVILVVGCLLTGCTSSTGWGVGFNIYPVTQMRNVQSLQGNQTDTRILKRAPASKTGETAEQDY